MLKEIMHYMNENHWYIIATIIICALLLWLFGCESQVYSIVDPTKKVCREEIELEANYLLGQAKMKLADLDQQDEIKRIALEQAAIFGTTGQFNPMGLMNTVISIAAVSFGLNRNQKYKDTKKQTTT